MPELRSVFSLSALMRWFAPKQRPQSPPAFVELHLPSLDMQRIPDQLGERVLINTAHIASIDPNPMLARLGMGSNTAIVHFEFAQRPLCDDESPSAVWLPVRELLPDGHEPLQGQLAYVRDTVGLANITNTSVPSSIDIYLYDRDAAPDYYRLRTLLTAHIGYVIEGPGVMRARCVHLDVNTREYDYALLREDTYAYCREVLLNAMWQGGPPREAH